jgi:hypothetical protein
MELHFDDISELKLAEFNPYIFVSKNKDVTKEELNNVIQIFDEFGVGVSYTYDKFVEIFDNKGLSGFVL